MQGMRVVAVLLCLMVPTLLAGAASVEDLYRCVVIVTGQDNLPERERGFRDALAQVMVKVTGDAGITADRGMAPLLDKASDLVVAFDYEDRKKGIPISDEQGTRDRSFYLRVEFARDVVDAAATALGRQPWRAERPKLLALLAVEDTVGRYVLGEESERGFGQREAFVAAGARLGVPLVLPQMDAAERRLVGYDDVAAGVSGTITSLVTDYGADALLAGTMTITPQGYWRTRWSLFYKGQTSDWAIDDTTFDRAIADAIARAARRFAGLDGA